MNLIHKTQSQPQKQEKKGRKDYIFIEVQPHIVGMHVKPNEALKAYLIQAKNLIVNLLIVTMPLQNNLTFLSNSQVF